LAKAGERVKVGAPILEFEEGPHAEAGTVVGQLSDAPLRAAAPEVGTPNPAAAGIRASPAVRARARDLGVELSSIAPTGPDRTITMTDVAAAARSGAAEGGQALRGARRTMAANMARAWREVAHATVQDAADIEAWWSTEHVTIRLVRAVVAGCKAEPALNASFDGATLTLRENATIDLGIAVDSPDGLFVPVLRDVAGATPQDWRTRIDTLKRGVQERSLAPADLRGATITLSNFGSIAGSHASLIVMPPQVAIVGVGRARMRAVQTNAGIAMHRLLPISLSFDHRAITGAMAARFMHAVIADLETAN
jgi:pyruvate dehydrogenase E2 component (dihydrolipoamide acetyltransferase)